MWTNIIRLLSICCFIAIVLLGGEKNIFLELNLSLGENGDDEPDVGWSSGKKYKLIIVDLKIYILRWYIALYLVYLSYPNKRLIQGIKC